MTYHPIEAMFALRTQQCVPVTKVHDLSHIPPEGLNAALPELRQIHDATCDDGYMHQIGLSVEQLDYLNSISRMGVERSEGYPQIVQGFPLKIMGIDPKGSK